MHRPFCFVNNLSSMIISLGWWFSCKFTPLSDVEARIERLTILLLPRMKIVTALGLAHSSITSIFSRVVPKLTSRTTPAFPSFAALRSSNLGTIRPFVAIAMSSISEPPTHRTAGSLFWSSRWLASSSKPHWQITRFAPVSLICLIISVNLFFSYTCSFLNSSTVFIASLCFVFGFGGSNAQVNMASLASLTSSGIWGCEKSLSMMTPFTSRVSSSEPPTFPSTLISSKSTSFLSKSATDRTASTAIWANWSWALETL